MAVHSLPKQTQKFENQFPNHNTRFEREDIAEEIGLDGTVLKRGLDFRLDGIRGPIEGQFGPYWIIYGRGYLDGTEFHTFIRSSPSKEEMFSELDDFPYDFVRLVKQHWKKKGTPGPAKTVFKLMGYDPAEKGEEFP